MERPFARFLDVSLVEMVVSSFAIRVVGEELEQNASSDRE